jgi:hypothetical protein
VATPTCGLGNLIIGYNEDPGRPQLTPTSSRGWSSNAKKAVLGGCENDRFRSKHRTSIGSRGGAVAKLCCFFLKNGNQILQQFFYVANDDLSVIDLTIGFETFCRQEDDLFSFLF